MIIFLIKTILVVSQPSISLQQNVLCTCVQWVSWHRKAVCSSEQPTQQRIISAAALLACVLGDETDPHWFSHSCIFCQQTSHEILKKCWQLCCDNTLERIMTAMTDCSSLIQPMRLSLATFALPVETIHITQKEDPLLYGLRHPVQTLPSSPHASTFWLGTLPAPVCLSHSQMLQWHSDYNCFCLCSETWVETGGDAP